MIKAFKTTAILEGISYLLFGLTMPLKYMMDMPMPNKIVGYAHGFLFIAYILLAFGIFQTAKYNIKEKLIILAASLIPFATFYVERKMIKND
jgi:integral membrane protein